jgi:hypothetical protein
MLGKNFINKSVSCLTLVAVWCVFSMVALAAGDVNGEITVTGQVTVNGQTTVSNSTVVSGSTITTSANSTAVVSLGKLGRVELQPETTLMFKFSNEGFTGVLSAGKLRVSNSVGVAATITTKDAAVVADSAQANAFVVEIENCGKCSNTYVNTAVGLVVLRGSGNVEKTVAAGTDATAGNPAQTGCPPCKRPGGTPAPFPVAGIGAGALAAILLGIGGAVGAAVLLGSGSETQVGGGVIVVSPTR